MLIAHISDTHITEYGKKAYGMVPSSEYLEKCIEHMNQFDPKLDMVLITGDLCATPNVTECNRAVEILSKLTIPYYIIPGNHDKREYLLDFFGGNACPTELDGFIQYTIDSHSIRIIALDSVTEGKSGGTLCKKRLSWLSEKLSEQPNKQTIIMLHHPPIKYGVHETNTDGFIGTTEFGDIIEKHSNIVRILCGHVHMNCHASWKGTTISTAASMGMQLGLDLTLMNKSEFSIIPPSYQVHYKSPGEELVSYVTPVYNLGAASGPFPFVESDSFEDE